MSVSSHHAYKYFIVIAILSITKFKNESFYTNMREIRINPQILKGFA